MELKQRMDKQYNDIIVSLIICVIIVFFTLIVNLKDMINVSKTIQVILICTSYLFCIISVPMIPHFFSYNKLRKNGEYIKLITGKCEKVFENLNSLELYFTDKSIIDITNLLLGIFRRTFCNSEI